MLHFISLYKTSLNLRYRYIMLLFVTNNRSKKKPRIPIICRASEHDILRTETQRNAAFGTPLPARAVPTASQMFQNYFFIIKLDFALNLHKGILIFDYTIHSWQLGTSIKFTCKHKSFTELLRY